MKIGVRHRFFTNRMGNWAIILIFLFALWGCEKKGRENPDRIPAPDEIVRLDKEPVALNLTEVKRETVHFKDPNDANIEGKVIVRVLISDKGEYVKHIVMSKVHPILENAVSKNVPELKFEPGMLDGEPTFCWMTIPFEFSMLEP